MTEPKRNRHTHMKRSHQKPIFEDRECRMSMIRKAAMPIIGGSVQYMEGGLCRISMIRKAAMPIIAHRLDLFPSEHEACSSRVVIRMSIRGSMMQV